MNNSHGTFYNWQSKFSVMETSDLKRPKELEGENIKFKKLLAEKFL
jgi:hypothetical protein